MPDRITRKDLEKSVAWLNEHLPPEKGRKWIVCSADARVGGYWIRLTDGDLRSGQRDVFHGRTAREAWTFLEGLYSGAQWLLNGQVQLKPNR